MSSLSEVALPQVLKDSFLSSFWIWTLESDPFKPPAGDRIFRRIYTTPSGKSATSALIIITMDDRYVLAANEQLVGTSPSGLDTWMAAQIYNVAPLNPTSNLFTIRGTNLPDRSTGDLFGAAGLLCAIQISFSDGTVDVIHSDGAWNSTSVFTEAFATDDSPWGQVDPIARYPSGVWGAQVALPSVIPQTTISLTSSAPATSATSASTRTSSDTPAPSISQPAVPGSSVNSGAIVGGSIGGAAVLVLFAVLVILLTRLRNRRKRRERAEYGGVIPSRLIGRAITPFPFTYPKRSTLADTDMQTNHESMSERGMGPSRDGTKFSRNGSQWGGATSVMETVEYLHHHQVQHQPGAIVHHDGGPIPEMRGVGLDIQNEIPPTYQSVRVR